MSIDAAVAVSGWLIVLCRVGACLSLLPGYSAGRIPVPVRIALAVFLSLLLAPLQDSALPLAATTSVLTLAHLIVTELLKGAALGLLLRVGFMALEFAAGCVSQLIGLQPMAGLAIDDREAGSPLGTLLSMTAIMLIFASGLHLKFIEALALSFASWPVTTDFDSRLVLRALVDHLGEASVVMLRIASPFIGLSIAMNLLLTVAGRMVPNVPTYFVVQPLVLLLGLVLLWGSAPDVVELVAHQLNEGMR